MSGITNRIKQNAAAAIAALLLTAAAAQGGETGGGNEGAQARPARQFQLTGAVGKAKFKNACNGVIAGFACEDEDDAWKIALTWRGESGLFSEIGYADLGTSEWRASGAESECRTGGAGCAEVVIS